MQDDRSEQHDPRDPEQMLAAEDRPAERAQPRGIVVEVLRPQEDLQVPIHVQEQEADQD